MFCLFCTAYRLIILYGVGLCIAIFYVLYLLRGGRGESIILGWDLLVVNDGGLTFVNIVVFLILFLLGVIFVFVSPVCACLYTTVCMCVSCHVHMCSTIFITVTFWFFSYYLLYVGQSGGERTYILCSFQVVSFFCSNFCSFLWIFRHHCLFNSIR